jgi:hypothetical protein
MRLFPVRTAIAAAVLAAALGGGVPHVLRAAPAAGDSRLAPAYRFARDGWIYVHLEGPPGQLGYEHGYLLAHEIDDAFHAVKLRDVHNSRQDWNFFRATAQHVLWPHIEAEYRRELEGITEGLQAQGVAMDLWDVVALNAMEEVPGYYLPWLQAQQKHAAPAPKAPGHCSAFVATGSWTKDHGIVMAHNNWTDYLDGERWRIIFDIVPAAGNHILMDGFPGIIVSDDDFGINSAGLMVTETTIGDFFGFDPQGAPEFVRARKALQYAGSIDEFVRIMNDGNNGGYANDWLLGDRKTGEIARFEQGLQHTRLWRTMDGYFEGANFPSDPQILKDETTFDSGNPSLSPNARRERWHQLLEGNKGRIDVALAQEFLADHYDTFEKKADLPSERTLCGHLDLSSRGFKGWLPPYYPGGAVQNKVTDSAMTADMMFLARFGHACGADFKSGPFLEQHPEFEWQKPVLHDMDAAPWSRFSAGGRK